MTDGVRSGVRLAAVVVALAAATRLAVAQGPPLPPQPRLYTHEQYVEEATRTTTLAIDDPVAVFAFVLGNLPDRVKVYPTENYYYFRFIHDGRQYAGNIRLDASDRDAGNAHFAYYEDLAEWKDEPPVTHVVLDASYGVTVEKLDRLVYRVSYGRKSVVFALNDLSDVRPPASVLGPDERFVGPIFDDSAIRFFLVYNSKLKIFHYILDETIPVAEDLVPSKVADRILIGQRTGFAYYLDDKLDRKILVGVFEGNARVNNYFDGPFDQLPDNFLEGDTLRQIILEVEPSLAGQIDRFGGSPDGSDRYLIAPYVSYRTEEDLKIFRDCAINPKIPPAQYYNCFVVDEDEAQAGDAAPTKLRPKKIRKSRVAHRPEPRP